MVETEFGLLEMKVKGMSGDAIELEQATFGEAPKAFDAVDVMRSASEFVLAMIDAKMLVEAQINQTVVPSPTIGVQHGFGSDSATNHRLESGFGGIRYDFRVDLLAPLEQSEDDGFSSRATTPFAAHATWAKVGFIGLDLAQEWRVALTGFGHPGSHSQENGVYGSNRNASHGRRLCRRQIQYKTTHQMAKLCFADFRMSKISVNSNHDRSLALSSKHSAS